MPKLTITIDFDGTIVEHRYPNIGLEAPGAFRWMKRFQELGAKLILLTMRSNGTDADYPTVLAEAVEFCRSKGVVFAHVNENPSQRTWTASPKVYSQVHIDDTNAACPLREAIQTDKPVVDWDIVGPWVEQRLLGNKEINPIRQHGLFESKPDNDPAKACEDDTMRL